MARAPARNILRKAFVLHVQNRDDLRTGAPGRRGIARRPEHVRARPANQPRQLKLLCQNAREAVRGGYAGWDNFRAGKLRAQQAVIFGIGKQHHIRRLRLPLKRLQRFAQIGFRPADFTRQIKKSVNPQPQGAHGLLPFRRAGARFRAAPIHESGLPKWRCATQWQPPCRSVRTAQWKSGTIPAPGK